MSVTASRCTWHPGSAHVSLVKWSTSPAGSRAPSFPSFLTRSTVTRSLSRHTTRRRPHSLFSFPPPRPHIRAAHESLLLAPGGQLTATQNVYSSVDPQAKGCEEDETYHAHSRRWRIQGIGEACYSKQVRHHISMGLQAGHHHSDRIGLCHQILGHLASERSRL